MGRRAVAPAAWLLIGAALSGWLFWPVLWLELELVDGDGPRRVLRMRAQAEETFGVRYVHSVERRPVTEYFVLDRAGAVVLTGVRYHGFGAGLPTDPGEGVFVQEGDAFVIEGLRRPVGALPVRLSPMNEYTVIHRGKQIAWPAAASGARLTVRGVRAGRLPVALGELLERSG